MITTLIFEFLGSGFVKLFSLINIPGIPNDLMESAYSFLDTLFSYADLVGLFVRISTLKYTCLLLIVIYNYDRIWGLFNFIFSKIPFINSFLSGNN